jgi:MFS transporter, DHA1 family, tetracycline resistance protein
MNAPAMPSPPARKGAVAFILVTVLLDVLTFGIIIPVLPLLVQSFAGSDGLAAQWIGWITSVFAILQLFCVPILGALSDRFGRRPVILISLAGAGINQLLTAFAPNLWWLLASRVIAGATAANLACANAYIADVSPPEQRARYFGLIGAAFGAGFIFGPVIGGLLGEIDLRLPFLAAAGLAGINFAYGLFVLPESLPKEHRRAMDWRRCNPVGSLQSLGRHPILTGLACASICLSLAFGILQTVWVLYITRRFGWGEFENGASLAAVGLGMMATGVMAGRVVKGLGDRRALLLGITLACLGYLAYGLSSAPWMLFVSIAIHSMSGITGPALQSIVTRTADKDEQGSVQGAFASLQSLVFIVAPLIGSQLFAAFSAATVARPILGMPFFFASAALALALLLAARTLAQHSAPSTEQDAEVATAGIHETRAEARS